MFQTGGHYPPKHHLKRIQRYHENLHLFLGDHHLVFEKYGSRLNQIQRDLYYVSVNIAGLICKKSADLLFGESPVILARGEENSPEQIAIERLTDENSFLISCYESALGNAFRGDSFFKIRYGTEYEGLSSEFKVWIEPQNAEYVFPETHPMDGAKIVAYHLAYPIEKGKVLHVESHFPGRIVQRQFEIKPTLTSPEGRILQWGIGEEIPGAYQETRTGVPHPLVVHIPNYALDHTWRGIDDISEVRPLLNELNHRLSLVASILDKHSDPSMVVPSGSLSEGEDGQPVFHAGRDKVFEVASREEILPTYITWNGELQSCFESIRTILDMILMVAEIPPVALGKDNSGTSGATGLSIKFRMQSLLSKINRKRQYYEKGIRKIYALAQQLEHAKASAKYPIKPIQIMFKDGLPNDDYEQAQIHSLLTGGKATLSQFTAIQNMYGYTDEQTQKEIERIHQEGEAELSNYRQTPASPDEI